MPYWSFSWCLHLLTHLWWVYRVCWPYCRGVARWQICSALHPTLTRSSSFPFLTGIGLCHCDFEVFLKESFPSLLCWLQMAFWELCQKSQAEIKLLFIPAERRESLAQGSCFQECFSIDFTDRCQPALSIFLSLISYTFILYFFLALYLFISFLLKHFWKLNDIHYRSNIWNFWNFFFIIVEISLLCSARLHFFDQKQ